MFSFASVSAEMFAKNKNFHVFWSFYHREGLELVWLALSILGISRPPDENIVRHESIPRLFWANFSCRRLSKSSVTNSCNFTGFHMVKKRSKNSVPKDCPKNIVELALILRAVWEHFGGIWAEKNGRISFRLKVHLFARSSFCFL